MGPPLPIAHQGLSWAGREELFRKPVLRREETRSRNFWGGVSPVETVLGLDPFYSHVSEELPIIVM